MLSALKSLIEVAYAEMLGLLMISNLSDQMLLAALIEVELA
jgi:hypothetical protein